MSIGQLYSDLHMNSETVSDTEDNGDLLPQDKSFKIMVA